MSIKRTLLLSLALLSAGFTSAAGAEGAALESAKAEAAKVEGATIQSATVEDAGVSQSSSNSDPVFIEQAGDVKNPAQQPLLDAISEQLQQSHFSRGHFEQRKFISVLPRPLLSTGQFTFRNDGSLEWQVIEPLQSLLVFNSEGIRQSQDGQLVWQLSGEQTATDMIRRVLNAALIADWRVLEDYFRLEASQQGEHWQLQLIPIDKLLLAVVTQVNLHGSTQLDTMTIFEANGDRTELAFSSYAP